MVNMSLFNRTLTQNRNMYITKLQQRNSAFSFIAVLHLENCSEIFNTEKSYFIVCIYYNKEGNIIMNTVYSFLPAEHSMIRETNHLRCKMIDVCFPGDNMGMSFFIGVLLTITSNFSKAFVPVK